MDAKTLPADVHVIELVFPDTQGILRGKRVPADQWPRVRTSGVAISGAAFLWGIRAELRDEAPAGGIETGFPDVTLIPIEDTFRILPWKPGVAQVFANVYSHNGDRHPLCPRNALEDVVKRIEGHGYEIKSAVELEFFLLDKETKCPISWESNSYGIADDTGHGEVLNDIQVAMTKAGIPVEAWNFEYSAAQFEMNVRYGDPLTVCDQATFFKNGVKEIALRHGYYATFMGKPYQELGSNGLHIHHSLWKDGENVFRAGENGEPCQDARHFIGGLQKRIAELSLLGSPTHNDFKRRVEGSFSPTRASWGDDNRTVAIRMIIDGSNRVEQRDASAAANPYLVMAGQLAAGYEGLTNEIEPSAKCTANSYSDLSAPELPRNVDDAADLLADSEFARTVFPQVLLDQYVDTSRWEADLFRDYVSPKERERFVGVI